jgi:DtxR family Mn-dependent transcriptional regulator
MSAPVALSRSVEDYLKVIYQLAERTGDAGTTEIAQRLDVAPASVTGMVKRMAEAGLLEHAPYRGVRLTAQGRHAALAVMRRHRILETYLITKLAYDWASVHAEAERLEHAVSDELVERMAFALGMPRYDPHGAPIPTSDGEIEPSEDLVPLAEVEAGARVTLRRVGDHDSERLRYLKSIGLVPMVEMTVLDKQPFAGPITLRVGTTETRDRAIGSELAASLLVERR